MNKAGALGAGGDSNHSRSFLDRETQRFIAAAWREDPDRPFFVLRDGEADLHRDLARRELCCVVSDCPSPSITTVARKNHRQGFRHLRAGEHSPEGFHHLQGKAVIADWLRRMPGGLQVELEQSVDTQHRRRARVADVMVTDPRTGHRTAFEVQYASISAHELRTRTDDYIAAGIGVVWLFGHAGVHMRARRSDGLGGATMRVGAAHAEVSATDGLPALWLNPAAGLLAMATTELDELLVQREPGRAQLTAFPLEEVTLVDGRLVSERFVAMAQHERVVAEARAAAQHRVAELWKQRKERQAKRIEEWKNARDQIQARLKREGLRPNASISYSMLYPNERTPVPRTASPQPRPELRQQQPGLGAE